MHSHGGTRRQLEDTTNGQSGVAGADVGGRGVGAVVGIGVIVLDKQNGPDARESGNVHCGGKVIVACRE